MNEQRPWGTPHPDPSNAWGKQKPPPFPWREVWNHYRDRAEQLIWVLLVLGFFAPGLIVWLYRVVVR